MQAVKQKKPKKEYRFLNTVMNDELMDDADFIRAEGYNLQQLIRNFVKNTAQQVREAKEQGTMVYIGK
ncbi:hypothetical protein [Massilia sp. WG5]|jgi:hypothetical protein|uniref:hypothetical protein n=1 Tax=Massilia sp. WG5 TaxID=1707785 RepID=UPI000B0A1BC2|nr:hypothetical protein [Massilia sp. WG5]